MMPSPRHLPHTILPVVTISAVAPASANGGPAATAASLGQAFEEIDEGLAVFRPADALLRHFRARRIGCGADLESARLGRCPASTRTSLD
jgi:hypothetical protein